MLEIGNQCSRDDSFQCAQAIISSIIAVSIMAFSIYCIVRIRILLNKWPYEVIPLSTTLLQAVMQFVLVFFYSDLKFLICALYSQALTFGFVSYSFIILYFRLKFNKKMHQFRKYIVYTAHILLIALITCAVLTLAGVFPIKCNAFLTVAYYIPMAFLFLIITIALVFGISLRNLIKNLQKTGSKCPNGFDTTDLDSNPIEQSMLSEAEKQDQFLENYREDLLEKEDDNLPHQQPQKAGGSELQLVSTNEDSKYFKIQTKSLKHIMITFIITGILQIFFDILREYAFKNDMFYCEEENDNKIFIPENSGGSVYLLFYQLVYLIPCTIVPYAFFYVPFFKMTGGNNMKIDPKDSGLNLDLDGEQERSALAKKKALIKKYNSSTFNSDMADEDRFRSVDDYKKGSSGGKQETFSNLNNIGNMNVKGAKSSDIMNMDDELYRGSLDKMDMLNVNAKDTFVGMRADQASKFNADEFMRVQANMSMHSKEQGFNASRQRDY